MKTLIALFAALSLTLIAAAQPPDTLWTRTFGGSSFDEGRSVQQTTDGGYIIAGNTESFGSGSLVYLIKTDLSGNQVWSHVIGEFYYSYSESVQQTSDGGYIIAGSTGTLQNLDVYLIKTNNSGNPVWQRTFGGSGDDEGWSVQQTTDGGYIIAGFTQSYGAGSYDVYLIKTDALGNTIWTRTFGGSGDDKAFSVQQTSEGGYIIAGYTYSYGADGDVYLIKTDSDGYLLWQRNFGGAYSDWSFSVEQTTDGGYIISGETLSYGAGSTDVYLIKTNESGNLIWQRTFGGSQADRGYCVHQMSNGAYVISGHTFSYGGGGCYVYLIKTDAIGDTVWTRTFGGSDFNVGQGMQVCSDGGYIITGGTISYGSGSRDVYLIKTTPDLAPPDVTITLIPFTLPIQIPATGGSFSFYVFANNAGTTPAAVTLWSGQILPDSTYMVPILGPYTLNLPPGTKGWFRHQNVPGSAMPGQYKYIGYAGVYPNAVWSSDTLIYTKSATGSGPLIGDWANTGDSFIGEEAISHQPSAFSFCKVTPNPFNPTTTISYELRAANYVTLMVYDTAGRLISTLVNGFREAGSHEVTFDGSDLPSGMFFVRLQAGDFTTVQKLLLLK